MSTLNYQKLTIKSTIIIILILGILLLIFLFSLQLQNKKALTYQSHARLFIPSINISTYTPLNIVIPTIIIPTINVPHIVIPTVYSINPILINQPLTVSIPPVIGDYISQGTAIIQQIIASPDAKNIIALFLASILSTPPSNTTPSTPSSLPDQNTNTPVPIQATSTPTPTIPPSAAPNPTAEPTLAAGQCRATPPREAGIVGCSTASYLLNHRQTSTCTTCAGVKAKANCTCPSGICQCNIPASRPPQTVTCSNNGILQITLCQ